MGCNGLQWDDFSGITTNGLQREDFSGITPPPLTEIGDYCHVRVGCNGLQWAAMGGLFRNYPPPPPD